MTKWLILLVALVVIVGLCKGAALENGNEPKALEVETAQDCKRFPSLCGRKKREIEQESPVETALDTNNCQRFPSLCGRKKREIEQESPVETAEDIDCKQAPALCGRKKREIEQESRVAGLCNGSAASLCPTSG